MAWKRRGTNWINGKLARALNTFHSEEPLRRIISRERARADRHGHHFSLLVFNVGSHSERPDAYAHLAAVLARRLRWTDDIGWFDESRVAAVLPDTPPEGACNVANHLCQALDPSVLHPACVIYTYPSGCRDHDDDGSDRARRQPGARARDPEWDSSVRDSFSRCEKRGSSTAVSTARTQALSQGGKKTDEFDRLFSAPIPAWKSALDIIGAAIGLVVFSPLMLLAAAAVKLTSPGPVIFRQPRVGRDGQRFTFYKFRTMHVGAGEHKSRLLSYNEQAGPAFKMKSDPRVTLVGRVLRKTSIDELPQLWNVLKRDMSLVGPRPPTLDEVQAYERWHRRRLDLTPGLTGIWQVSGRSQIGFTEWVRMDIRYAEARSCLLDLEALLRTVPAVLSGRGAH